MPRSVRTGRRASTRILAATAIAVVASSAPAAAVQRRAFVTSISGNGNLATWPGAAGATALDRADSVCRALAADAEPAALPNANLYRAWLSTTTTDAYCHVQGLEGKRAKGCDDQPLPGAGPWFLSNGLTQFTGELDDLVAPNGVIYRSAMLDENGVAVSTDWIERRYWTGTFETGGVAWTSCEDWTSADPGDSGFAGDAYGAANLWTNRDAPPCDTPRRLLCLEPDPGDAVHPDWSPAALVFLSSEFGSGKLSTWPHAGVFSGINAAYQVCERLAEESHLPAPDSFVPWLSTTLVEAAERVDVDGPFRRIDGTRVAGTFADMVDGSLNSGIYQTEDGAYLTIPTNSWVWTGTAGDGSYGGSNCLNWVSDSNDDTGIYGRAGYGGIPAWTIDNARACSQSNRLYCISNVITLFWDGFDLTGDASRWSDAVAP